MRPIRTLVLVLTAGLVVGSILAWPQLPARLPVHFGADGRPDAWADRSLLSWFLLPAIAVLSTALLLFIPTRPRFLNVPDKERFLRLSAARQAPVLALVRTSLDWIALWVTSLLALIQYGAWRTAQGAADGRGWILAALAVGLVGSLGTTVVLLSSLQNRIDEAIRLDERDRASAPAAR